MRVRLLTVIKAVSAIAAAAQAGYLAWRSSSVPDKDWYKYAEHRGEKPSKRR